MGGAEMMPHNAFMKSLRREIKPHIEGWIEKAKSEFNLEDGFKFEDFIKYSVIKKKPKQIEHWRVNAFARMNDGIENFIQLNIDGATYKILNHPKALCTVYRRAR